MPFARLQQKSYQLEDRVMEGYAMAYRAYLARRGPEPTLVDFVEIRKLQAEIEDCRPKTFQLLMTPTSSRAHGALCV
jgi:hypothetical protein